MNRNVLLVVCATAFAVLAALGIGPLVVTLIQDLVPGLARPLLVYPAVTITGAAAFLGAWASVTDRVSTTEVDQDWKSWIRSTLIIFLALSTVASLFLAWEGDNLFSWRMARLTIASDDVSLKRFELRGTHTLALRLEEPVTRDALLAQAPLPQHLGLSGGHFTVGIRAPGKHASLGPAPCFQQEKAGTRANKDLARTIFIDVRTGADCAQWKRFDVTVEPNTSLIQLRSKAPIQVGATIELAFLDRSVAYQHLWLLASALASSLMAAAVLCILRLSNRRFANNDCDTQPILHWRRSDTRWTAIAVALFLIVANSFVYGFVSSEKTIYTWDFGGHWMSAINVSKALTGDLNDKRSKTADLTAIEGSEEVLPSQSRDIFDDPGMLATLTRNIRYDEYNLSAAIPVAIPMAIFGPSRMVYELSLVNVFGLASLAALLVSVWHFLSRSASHIPKAWPLIPVLVMLGFSQFWVPLVRGYLGAVIVALDLLLIWLYFRRSISRQSIVECALIGVILGVSIVVRRWNAIWAVAFMSMMLLDAGWHLYKSRRFCWIDIINSFRVMFLVEVTAFLTLAIAAWPLVITMTVTDYSDIYSAYANESSTILGHAHSFLWTYGLGTILLFTAAGAYLVSADKYRRLAVMLLALLSVSVVYFSSIQKMGPHHMYLLMPALFLMMALALLTCFSRSAKTRLFPILAVSLYAANGVAASAAIFLPGASDLQDRMTPILPENQRWPLVRHDIPEVIRIASYLDRVLDDWGSDAHVYILASSTAFSVAQLKMLEASTGFRFSSKDRILNTAAIDKRDGFPHGLLQADIVLLAEPAQIHRSPDDHHVITTPIALLLNDSKFRRAFVEEKVRFYLDQGIVVRIFRRTRPSTAVEINELSSALKEFYPDRPKIFSP